MLIRVKILLRLMSIISVGVIVYVFIRILLDGEPATVRQVALLITFSLWAYLFTLVIPTLKVLFNDKGYVVAYGISVGPIRLGKFESMLIPWGNVTLVYSLLPAWVPFRMIGVSGKKNGTAILFFLVRRPRIGGRACCSLPNEYHNTLLTRR